MGRGYLIGLDAGGGGGRCLLLDVASGNVHSAFRPWTFRPVPGTAGLGYDLDLEAVWAAFADATREVLERTEARPEEVLGLAAGSMRFALVVTDAAGGVLYAGPNRDARAVEQALVLASASGAELHRRTGLWPNPVLAAPRLQWLAATSTERWNRAATVLSVNDWVTWRLCGVAATERSQAGATQLFDIERQEWAWDWIDRLGFPRRIFPELRAPGSKVAGLTHDAAAVLGLRAGTPVAVGGGDTQLGLLGAGAVASGDAAAITGTSTPVQLVLDHPLLDPDGRLWATPHVVADRWILESNAGPMGEVLEWFARLVYPESPNPLPMLFAEADLSQPGAGGMLSSLGADVMDAHELKMPVGHLTLSHVVGRGDAGARPHLVRSILEGMAYAVRANLDQILDVARLRLSKLHLGGGMSRSAVWSQLVGDVTGLPVAVASSPESTALGAALCAGVGAGVYRDLAAAAADAASRVRVVEPEAGRAACYEGLYASWRQLRTARSEADRVARDLAVGAAFNNDRQDIAPAARAPRPRMLVTAEMDDDALAALGALGEVKYAGFRRTMQLLAGSSLVAALEGIQVFVTEVDVVDVAVLQRLPELRLVAACRGDAVNVDVDACTAFGIPVLHAPGRNAEAVADLTLAYLLMLARRLPEASVFLRQPGGEAGDIGRMGRAFSRFQGAEIGKRTVGLVGLGAVGRAVARRLRGFGGRVLVFDPYVSAQQIVLAGAEAVSLDTLLAESDFVSLHAPLTDTSRHLIGARELARMKPGAALINTARAGLVDEDALAEALRNGHLSGAALDVFSVEPPAANHPLLALETVIATPHVGGNTVDVAAHQGRIIAADLERLLRGLRPHHVLNPAVLEAFDWSRPRPGVDAALIEKLAARSRPAVTDLQVMDGRRAAAGGAAAVNGEATAAAASGTAAVAPRELRNHMERLLHAFVTGFQGDAALHSLGADKDVTLHFVLSDLDLACWLRLRAGALAGGLGQPDPAADVQLKMRGEIFDGVFTGVTNPMQAAMDGRLSFSGDTVKAMTLAELQEDLCRVYRQSRQAVGDPGDLASLAPPSRDGASARPVRPGDLRHELVEVVGELYAKQVVTATGGNISVRIPGTQEIWITPSQLFKGGLRPEMLVRIGLDGEPRDPDALSPSSERLMHCAVYAARTEVGAVVHAHAPHATILANAGLPFLPISTEAAFFGDIPRVPFIMPGTRELAEAVGEALRDSWAVLMQNHGLLAAGRSLRRAADAVEIIERSAEIVLGCYAVGKEPPVLPDAVVARLRKMGDLVA